MDRDLHREVAGQIQASIERAVIEVWREDGLNTPALGKLERIESQAHSANYHWHVSDAYKVAHVAEVAEAGHRDTCYPKPFSEVL